MSETTLEGFYRVKGRQCEGQATSPGGFNHGDAGSYWRVRGREHGRRSPLFVLPPLFCFLAGITAALCPPREWEARGGVWGVMEEAADCGPGPG